MKIETFVKVWVTGKDKAEAYLNLGSFIHHVLKQKIAYDFNITDIRVPPICFETSQVLNTMSTNPLPTTETVE